jgi:serine protease Do
MSELQEQVGKYRPGEKLNILVNRKGTEKSFSVMLKNLDGTTSVVKKSELTEVMESKLSVVTADEKTKLGIKNGVKVVSAGEGKFAAAGIGDGFIIVAINNKAVNTPEDVKSILDKIKSGGVYIEGVYPNGTSAYYAFGL